MCIKKSELESKVNELRSLKILKEETENEIRALESSIIEFLQETEECQTMNKEGKPILQYIGLDFKATYAEQERKNVDRDAVEKLLTAEDFAKVLKISRFGVLRIK